LSNKENDRKAPGVGWIAGILGGAILVVVSVVLIANFISSDDQAKPSEETELPKILVFQAVPPTINVGEMSTLQWEAKDATQVILNGELVADAGNKEVRPQRKTSYTLIARNEKGEITSETIEVDIPSPLPPKILTFKATPSTITMGKTSTLSWQTQDATQVRINGELVADVGNKDVRLQRRTSYTLIARNKEGATVSETIGVDVHQAVPPNILSFKATPSTITSGKKSTLSWETQDATQVRLDGKLVADAGNKDVRPKRRTSYTLIARNEKGETVSETIWVDISVLLK
jgi:peptidyl-tRNA hydrolase